MAGRILSNPFFIYIGSFVTALSVYMLEWSNLYPRLDSSTIFFLVLTFLFAVFCGLFLDKTRKIRYVQIKQSDNQVLITAFIWISYIAEFVYNKGVPLLVILNGDVDYDYRLFGIPTFHVLVSTFGSFYSIYLFHQFLSTKQKKILLLSLVNALPLVLIYSRGMIFMVLTSCFFIYVASLNTLKVKTMITVLVVVLIILYAFGIMGNLREGKEISSKYILEISKASNNLKDSIVPNEYIWAYLYISSPLSNFQSTIDKTKPDKYDWVPFFIYELIPDFISKRLGAALDIEREDVPRVASWLTVSTFYARAYYFVGWIGILIMFLFFISTTFIYIFLLRRDNPYFMTGLSILTTLVLYNSFDNMYVFSGLSFQLVYPLLFQYLGFANSSK
jgi:hypothetical protein